MKESLCWDCARCYALPDPQGCAWHRHDPEGNPEGKPFNKAKEHKCRTKHPYLPLHYHYIVTTVLKCDDFTRK